MSITDVRTEAVADQLPKGLLDNIVTHHQSAEASSCSDRARRGDAREDSDWDVLVVVDDDTRQEQVELAGDGRSHDAAYELRSILIPYPAIDVSQSAQTFKGSLAVDRGDTTALVVYERAEAA